LSHRFVAQASGARQAWGPSSVSLQPLLRDRIGHDPHFGCGPPESPAALLDRSALEGRGHRRPCATVSRSRVRPIPIY